MSFGPHELPKFVLTNEIFGVSKEPLQTMDEAMALANEWRKCAPNYPVTIIAEVLTLPGLPVQRRNA